MGASDHLLVILAELARRGRTFRFHTPNGLHARLITREVARGLKRANFATLRLGVETTALGAGPPGRANSRRGNWKPPWRIFRRPGLPPE